MGLSPRVVTQDRHITWDGVTQRLPKGQVLDVPPGSALERAIGRDYLIPLGAVAAQPEPEKPAEKAAGEPPAKEAAPQKEEESGPAAPPKPGTAAKSQVSGTATAGRGGDGKDGDS
jgi:hypothetical protein